MVENHRAVLVVDPTNRLVVVGLVLYSTTTVVV